MTVSELPSNKAEAKNLLDFIAKAPTAYQAVFELKAYLNAQGFREYSMDELRDLKTGDLGYYTKNDSALLAFRVGHDPLNQGLRIFGAHSDSPSLKIKPNAMSEHEGIRRLTTEVYGGALLNTWFDRPLSLAGRVLLRSENPLKPKSCLLDLKKPLLILPNLAIHMNREANEGVKIERHKVLLPFTGPAGEAKDEDWLKKVLAKELDVEVEDILDYDLYTYEVNPPSFVGEDDCFMSAGRLDNLFSSFCGIQGLIQAEVQNGLAICLVTDHEEVGSGSKQGALSAFIRDVIEQLLYGLGANQEDILAVYDKSFMISADCAHAVHPNYADYADPTHRPKINGGPVIKYAASQSYATDAASAAVFKQLCQGAGVPCQSFVNRSDLRGGSTIGPLTSRLLPVSTVDIGTAIWGMHSVRETGGSDDVYYLTKLATHFFSL